MKKVVIDTGVIISALLKKEGTSRKAFLKAVNDSEILVALETLSELEEVMERPKFKKYFSFEDKREMLELLINHGKQIEIVSNLPFCRDTKDDIFLNLAIDGKADVILSRDPDLLILHPFHNIPILNPAGFLAWIEQLEEL